MAAHAGERAEKTGTFDCYNCGETVRVSTGDKIPSALLRWQQLWPAHRRTRQQRMIVRIRTEVCCPGHVLVVSHRASEVIRCGS